VCGDRSVVVPHTALRHIFTKMMQSIPSDTSSERFNILLKKPILVPPTPDDECYVDGKGRVYATFQGQPVSMQEQTPILIGWISPRADPSLIDKSVLFSDPVYLQLLTSGDGYTIPVRKLVPLQ